MTTAPDTRRVEREDVLLWIYAFAPMLAWIAAQQLSFLVARSICATGDRWVLFLVMGSALTVTAAAGAASWTKRNARASYRRFMALGGVLLAAICGVAIVSLMIPAALHRVCD